LETFSRARSALRGGYAAEAAADIRAGKLSEPRGTGSHSHQLGAVDSGGLMISATHTFESDSWADAGLFVDGVELNSIASQVRGVTLARASAPSAFVDVGFLGAVDRRDDGTVILAADPRVAGVSVAG